MKTWFRPFVLVTVVLLLGTGAAPGGQVAPAPDDRAIEIALKALDAVERGWALGVYDRASRFRAAINLRGASFGVTANAVIDRPGRRWRLDAGGDVGPLTLLVAEGSALLHVPPFRQHARGRAGALAPGASVGRSLTAELEAMRARLEDGYAPLVYHGEETLGGWRVHRLVDQPAPGATASYWIDAETYLPRRIALSRPGAADLRLDFAYGRGPRPIRIDTRVEGERPIQVASSPAYDGEGRVKHLHVTVRAAGAPPLEADVNLDWAPRLAEGFFRVVPPADSREVPFAQLAQGVLFQAAGALGAIARALAEGA